MALDPSIILGYKAPEIQNPMDVAAKALTMRQLSGQVKAQDQSLADDQAVRQAMGANTSVGANGLPNVNSAGVLSGVAGKVGLKSYQDLSTSLQSMDANQRKQLAQQSLSLAHSANPQNWQQIRQQAIAISPHPDATAASFPPEYNEQFLNTWSQHAALESMDPKDQLEFGNKQQTIKIDQQNADAKTKGANAAAQNANTNEKVRGSNEYSKTTMLLNGSRVPKDVVLAKVDAYNTDKANEMLKDFPDINKMDSTMAHTYLGEIAKIAQGGAPTIEALKGLDPGTLPEKASHAWQTVIGSPTPANLGAFLTEMRSYANRVGDGARQTVLKYNQGVLDTRQDFHNTRQQQLLKQTFIDPYAKAGQQNQSPQTVKMLDPKGNIREVPSDQVDAAKAAGGKLYGG